MEIQLEINNNLRKINLKSINLILGNNCSGKTTILNTIKSGLDGKEDIFMINGINCAKGMFEYIYIDENRDLEGEMHLKAKSYIHQKKLKDILLENEDQIAEITNNYIQQINQIFTNEKYQYIHSQLQLGINEEKTKKLENIIFQLSDIDNISMATKEEFYIKQRLEDIKLKKINLVIIDDIDRYLDTHIISDIINTLKDENITVIFTSKNKYLLHEIEVNKIFNTKLKEIKLLELAKVKMFSKYLEKENINMTLDDYILKNNDIFYEEDYQKYLKKEKKSLINELEL